MLAEQHGAELVARCFGLRQRLCSLEQLWRQRLRGSEDFDPREAIVLVEVKDMLERNVLVDRPVDHIVVEDSEDVFQAPVLDDALSNGLSRAMYRRWM